MKKHKHRKTKLKEFYWGLALDKSQGTMILASCGLNAAEVRASVLKRVGDALPILVINLMTDPATFWGRFSLWLAENDIIGADQAQICEGMKRQLGIMIDRKFAQNRKERINHGP